MECTCLLLLREQMACSCLLGFREQEEMEKLMEGNKRDREREKPDVLKSRLPARIISSNVQLKETEGIPVVF